MLSPGAMAGKSERERLSSALGAVIRQRRRTLGLSQEGLAERAGIHPTHVGLIERAERTPSVEIVWRIARALDIKLSALIRRVERQASGRKPV